MARKAGYKVTIAIPVLLQLLGNGVDAAINRTLDYSLLLESNSDREDRLFSDLRLNINDDFYSSRYTGSYSLDSNFFYDHQDSDSNDQHRGIYDSQIHMIRSTAWWNVDAVVELLPVASDAEIDEFSSQTVSTLSTGPTLSLGRNMRGDLILSLLASEVRYTESMLDSSRAESVLDWVYPLNAASRFGLRARHLALEYRDPENAANDFDLSSLELSYNRDLRNLAFNASVSANRIDGESRSTDIEGAAIDVSYRINQSSSVEASVSDSLQTSEAFNRLPGNLEVAQLEAGLLRNRRVGLGYRYDYQGFNLSADLFANDVENVISDNRSSDRIDGLGLRVSDALFEDYRYSATYERTENERTGVEEEEIDLSVSYVKIHGRRISSETSVFVEFDSTDGERRDNSGLRYRLNARLF